MMSHYIPLNPTIFMDATRISPPWDELCRLEPIGMNFRQRRQWRDTKKTWQHF